MVSGTKSTSRLPKNPKNVVFQCFFSTNGPEWTQERGYDSSSVCSSLRFQIGTRARSSSWSNQIKYFETDKWTIYDTREFHWISQPSFLLSFTLAQAVDGWIISFIHRSAAARYSYGIVAEARISTDMSWKSAGMRWNRQLQRASLYSQLWHNYFCSFLWAEELMTRLSSFEIEFLFENSRISADIHAVIPPFWLFPLVIGMWEISYWRHRRLWRSR